MWFWFFIFSFLLNVFVLFYVRWLVKSINTMNQEIEVIYEVIRDFALHVKEVHDLEMFYGDETLKKLMTHASELSGMLADIDLIVNEEEEEEVNLETQKT